MPGRPNAIAFVADQGLPKPAMRSPRPAGAPWRSDLATNLDTSLGDTGLTPSFAIWMPDCGVHEGAYDDRQFFEVSIDHSVGSRTMRSLLESFMTYSRTGLRSMYRDDWADSVGYASQTVGCN